MKRKELQNHENRPEKSNAHQAGRIQRANYKWIYLFLLPTIVIFAMFYLMPIAQVFVTSFTKWDGFNAPKFNGLTNYINLFTNSSFLIALKNLLWWCVIALTLHVASAHWSLLYCTSAPTAGSSPVQCS